MKPIFRSLTIALLCAVAFPQSKTPPLTKPSAPQAEQVFLLPPSFAGWKQTAVERSTDPAKADPANAALLKESGFAEEERAEYQRDSRFIKVSAVRFADAGGALGAYTFYRQPDAIREDVGD